MQNLLSVGGPSASVMETNHITIIGPDVSKLFDQIVFLSPAIHDL